MNPLVAAVIVLAVVVVLLGAAGAGMLRRIRELELAVYRGVGFRLATAQARESRLELTTPGRVGVVAKLTRRCPVCADVLQELGKSTTAASELEFVVVSDDPELAGRAPAGVKVITDPAAWRAVDVPFAPALLIVDEHGVVVDSIPAGGGHVVADVVARASAMRKVEAS